MSLLQTSLPGGAPTAPDGWEIFHSEGGRSYHSATAEGQQLSSVEVEEARLDDKTRRRALEAKLD